MEGEVFFFWIRQISRRGTGSLMVSRKILPPARASRAKGSGTRPMPRPFSTTGTIRSVVASSMSGSGKGSQSLKTFSKCRRVRVFFFEGHQGKAGKLLQRQCPAAEKGKFRSGNHNILKICQPGDQKLIVTVTAV